MEQRRCGSPMMIWPVPRLAAMLALAACAVPAPAPPLAVPAEGPLVAATAVLSSAGPVHAGAIFDLPSAPRRATRLTLRSLEIGEMPARITCDGPAQLVAAAGNGNIRPGSTRSFRVAGRYSRPSQLELAPEVERCTLVWGAGNRLAMVRTDLADPDQHLADTGREACRRPRAGAAQGLARVFYGTEALDQTCAMPPGPVDFAIDPLDGLNARVEALTGQTLSREALLSGNPDLPIDFSRAPKLDLIVLSYLHIRADFSGHLTRRMIEFHAARGTRVRILTSATLMLDLDRRYWEGLAARHPNVQLQYFKWNPPGPTLPEDVADTIQRSNHTKVFLTLSPEPGRSRFIIGGRNLHDGFFFDDVFDVSGHPELRDYTAGGLEGLAWHTVYYDFEIVMRGDTAVRQVANHFARLWNRDLDGAVALPMTRPGKEAAVPEDGVARHFVSYPWADGQAMDAYYTALIDAAQTEIYAASPFLYPTPAIEAALVRAAARGVRVVLVSRINSTDPPAIFTTALNHAFLNRHVGRFELWNYEPEDHLMHAKLLVIDGRLAVVASTNLNARSFLHDTENGMVFLDRKMAARLKRVVEAYIEDGEAVTETVQSTGLARAIGGVPWIWQYF